MADIEFTNHLPLPRIRLRTQDMGDGTLALVSAALSEGVARVVPMITAAGLLVYLRVVDMGDGTYCIGSGGTPTPGGTALVAEDGNTMITEDGLILVTE